MASGSPDPPLQPSTSPKPSNSPSVASDSFSISTLASTFPTYLTAASPPAEYISQPNASRIATEAQSPAGPAGFDSDPAGDVERSISVVSVSAVTLFNSFLDKLLYDVLNSSRSTNLAALKHAVLTVLRKTLARDAIASAEANLQDLLAYDEEDDDDDDTLDAADDNNLPQKRDPLAKWNQEHAWRRSRLRVMMRSELSEFDIDDDERYAEDIAVATSDRRLSSQSALRIITLSSEIFLAGILDFVGEHFIALAVPFAVARARRRSLRNKVAPTSHVLVEEPDIEKALLNSPLDRAWRSWRKSLRNRPYSSASQRLQALNLSTPSSPVPDKRISSNSLPAPVVDEMPMPGTMPGAFVETPGEWRQMPNIPENHNADSASASNQPSRNISHADASGLTAREQETETQDDETALRRQSGPSPARNSIGISMRRLIKQRSASLPSLIKGTIHHKSTSASASTTPEQSPGSSGPVTQRSSRNVGSENAMPADSAASERKSSLGKKDSSASASRRASEASTSERRQSSGTGAADPTTAMGFGAGNAAQNHTPSPKEMAAYDNRTPTDEPMARNQDEIAGARAISPKARNREAAVGMGYPNGISMPRDVDRDRFRADVQTASRQLSTADTQPLEAARSDFNQFDLNKSLRDHGDKKVIANHRTGSPGAQSESKQVLTSSVASSPTLGYRTRAASQGKLGAYDSPSTYSRSDSLRRLAVENNSNYVAAVDEKNNRVVTRSPMLGSSITSVEDFDSLIQGADTIKLTLSPQSVRDAPSDGQSARSSFDQQAVVLPSQRNTQDDSTRNKSSRRPTLESGPNSGSIAEEEDDGLGINESTPRTRPHMRTKSSGNARLARDATVQTHSTQDFADFIRSTGPNNKPQPQMTALPSPAGGTSARQSDKTHLGPAARSVNAPSAPAVSSRAGLRMPSRFKAREAKGSDMGNSDLIDFIRSGPETRGRPQNDRVDKNIAPFLSMDGDEIDGQGDQINGAEGGGLTPSAAAMMGRANRGSVSTTATAYTYNSRAPLVGAAGNSRFDNSATGSVVSGMGNTLFDMESISRHDGYEASPPAPVADEDGRKRYRNKDIYALPSSDEEDDFGDSSEAPKIVESTKPVLNGVESAVNGNNMATVKQPPTGLALDGVSYHQSSTASVETAGATRPVSAPKSISRPGSKPKLEMRSPGNANKQIKAVEMQDSSRHTRDLADFLNSSAPPGDTDKPAGLGGLEEDDEDGAPAPFVGQTGSRPTSRKSNKFWKRKKTEAA